jgi:hypothetical protein
MHTAVSSKKYSTLDVEDNVMPILRELKQRKIFRVGSAN